jgi:hypothetical protein
MAEQHIVTTLRDKQRAIQSAIANYERELGKARRDLANVNAVLAMYARDENPKCTAANVSVAMVFKRGEIFAICRKALEAAPEGLDTRQLAAIVLRERGLDANAHLGHSLRGMARVGRIAIKRETPRPA